MFHGAIYCPDSGYQTSVYHPISTHSPMSQQPVPITHIIIVHATGWRIHYVYMQGSEHYTNYTCWEHCTKYTCWGRVFVINRSGVDTLHQETHTSYLKHCVLKLSQHLTEYNIQFNTCLQKVNLLTTNFSDFDWLIINLMRIPFLLLKSKEQIKI